MFKKKDLEMLLGVGSVRAPIADNEQPCGEPIAPMDEVEAPENVAPTESTDEQPVPNANQQLVAAYENQIAFLQQQLTVKDEQLNSKDDIIKNFQVLLKLEQDTVLKLTHQIEETPKPSGWRSWFGRKKQEPIPDEQ